MNELKINKFIKQIIFLDDIEDKDLKYEYSTEDEKYYIYHNFSLKLLRDKTFSINLNRLIDKTFEIDEINKFELVGNKIKLKELNHLSEVSQINAIAHNVDNLIKRDSDVLERSEKIETLDLITNYEKGYGVAS